MAAHNHYVQCSKQMEQLVVLVATFHQNEVKSITVVDIAKWMDTVVYQNPGLGCAKPTRLYETSQKLMAYVK